MISRSRGRLALVIALAALACSGPAAVRLQDGWPAVSIDYEDAYERWTRDDDARRGLDLVADITATLKSPEWRAAYVAERARRALLSPEQRARLEAEQRAEAEQYWEFEMLVATYHYTWNDFARRAKSMWRLSLSAGDREVAPASIHEDRRPRGEIEAWFPALGPFHRAYIVRFPKTTADGLPLVGPDTKSLTLRVGSALGAVALVWSR